MNHRTVFTLIVVGVVCSLAGYWLALPAKKTVAPATGVPVNVVSIRDTTSSELWRIEGEYPQFGNTSSSFNATIADFVRSNLAQFQSDSEANQKARMATEPSGTTYTLPPQSYYFTASWEPKQVNARYISVIVRIEYFNGGANETQLLKTFNYDVAKGQVLALADLFPGVPTYLQQIAELTRQELENSLQSASDGNVQEDMLQSGTAPTTNNYANFTFNDEVVTIYFPKYQVAPGVFGEQKVIVIRSTIGK
jgi:hypothetical protein